MKYILSILLITTTALFSETFIKEYTYNASDNDSKVSARKAALVQIQMLVIEEVGINVQSKFTSTTTSSKGSYLKVNKKVMETFAHAVTKSKILKEKWDGKKFYLKVQIEVDKSILEKNFPTSNEVKNTKPKVKTLNKEELCKKTGIKIKEYLYDLSTDENVLNMVNKAIQYPYDNCNKWHKDVILTLSNMKITNIKYTEFLFQTLKNIKQPSLDSRAKRIISYVVSSMDKNNFPIVLNTIKNYTYQNVNNSLYILSKGLNNNIVEHVFEILFTEASKKTIGKPVAIVQNELYFSMLYELANHHFFEFSLFYTKYQDKLTLKEQNLLYDKALGIYSSRREFKLTSSFLSNYFKLSKPSESLAHKIEGYIHISERIGKSDKKYIKQMKKIILENEDNINKSFEKTKYISALFKRKKLFLKYDLKGDFRPKAVEISKELLDDKNINIREDYLELLEMMSKEELKVAEKNLIKYIKKNQKNTDYEIQLKVRIYSLLGKIKTTNKKAILEIVKYFNSDNKSMHKQTIKVLEELGYSAFEILKRKYDRQKRYLHESYRDAYKVEIIQIMGTYKEHKKEVVKFLKSIKTNTDIIKDAIQESITDLS